MSEEQQKASKVSLWWHDLQLKYAREFQLFREWFVPPIVIPIVVAAMLVWASTL